MRPSTSLIFPAQRATFSRPDLRLRGRGSPDNPRSRMITSTSFRLTAMSCSASSAARIRCLLYTPRDPRWIFPISSPTTILRTARVDSDRRRRACQVERPSPVIRHAERLECPRAISPSTIAAFLLGRSPPARRTTRTRRGSAPAPPPAERCAEPPRPARRLPRSQSRHVRPRR